MQTLWTRAAQTRCTCNCTFCHSTTKALSRSTTSGALKRRLRLRDVFTVFYSSVLASAAVADVSRKEAKKTEWERLIKEARDDLKALEDQQQARLAAIKWQGDDKSKDLPQHSNTWDDVFEWATRERRRRKTLGFQYLKGAPLNLLEDLSAPQIEILRSDKYISRLNGAEEGHLWHAVDGRELSVKKIKTLEWSVRKLVHRLILSSLEQRDKVPEKGKTHTSYTGKRLPFMDLTRDQVRAKLDRCEQRLRFLSRHTSHKEYWYRFESPHVPTYSRKSPHDLPRADWLNIRLHDIFELSYSRTMGKDTLIAHICSALLLSYTPPNVHTYNMLIIRLIRLKQMDDVSALITSMLESHIRPNEVTLCAVLHFYTITNNRRAFINLLRRMDGKDGGIRLAYAATEVSELFSDRFKVSEKSEVKPVRITQEQEAFYYERGGYALPRQPRDEWHSTRKVVERANMTLLNHAVYGAVIHGALKFFGSLHGMNFYSRMICEGWRAGRRELGGILQYCNEKMEWHDGLAVWRELCRLPEGADRTCFSLMLNLCRSRRKYVEFGQVLDYGVRQGLIPYTVWSFPDHIRGGDVGDLLRSAEVLWSANMLALPITIARDFIERNLETLGYGIASLALELDEICLNGSQTSVNITGLEIYLSIRRLHRESPAAATHRARNVAYRCLRERSQQDARNHGIYTSESIPAQQDGLLRCGCCGVETPSISALHSHLLSCQMVGVNVTGEDKAASQDESKISNSPIAATIESSADEGVTSISGRSKAETIASIPDLALDIFDNGDISHKSDMFDNTDVSVRKDVFGSKNVFDDNDLFHRKDRLNNNNMFDSNDMSHRNDMLDDNMLDNNDMSHRNDTLDDNMLDNNDMSHRNDTFDFNNMSEKSGNMDSKDRLKNNNTSREPELANFRNITEFDEKATVHDTERRPNTLNIRPTHQAQPVESHSQADDTAQRSSPLESSSSIYPLPQLESRVVRSLQPISEVPFTESEEPPNFDVEATRIVQTSLGKLAAVRPASRNPNPSQPRTQEKEVKVRVSLVYDDEQYEDDDYEEENEKNNEEENAEENEKRIEKENGHEGPLEQAEPTESWNDAYPAAPVPPRLLPCGDPTNESSLVRRLQSRTQGPRSLWDVPSVDGQSTSKRWSGSKSIVHLIKA